MSDTYDVVVVGAGTMGALALWHLSRMRGEDGAPLRVVALEQYGRVHTHGAFSGESRLFRAAAKEGRLFTAGLLESRQQWQELGRLSGRDLLVPAGVLSVAPLGHPDVADTKAAIDDYGLPFREFDADELRAQFPQFAVEDEDAGLLDVLGGALRPEAAVFAATRLAAERGVEIRYQTTVTEIADEGSGVRVETSDGPVRARRAIVTAGPWTGKLLPELAPLLQVASFALTWFMPKDIGMFMPDRFPGFMRDLGDVHAFGAPSFDGATVKISPHLLVDPVAQPNEINRTLTRAQLRWMGEQAQRMFPSVDPEPVRWSVHPDAETVDHRPIIDVLERGRIVVATGMSGNGFKLAPIYGQALAELAVLGESSWQHEEFTIAHHRALRTQA